MKRKALKYIFARLVHERYFCTPDYIVNCLFMLELTLASLFLLPSITFESSLAQTDMSIQENGNNNLGNNTITYSYNIYSNNNTREASTRLHNSSVSYYDNNTTGYLVYPELANNTQQQELMPAVIIIHEWLGLNEHIKTKQTF
jgi:hypothetical protein